MKKIDFLAKRGKELSDKLPDWQMPKKKKRVHRRDNYEEYRVLVNAAKPWSK